MTIFLMLARSNICCLQTKHDDQKWSTAAKQKLELFSFCNSRFSVVFKKKVQDYHSCIHRKEKKDNSCLYHHSSSRFRQATSGDNIAITSYFEAPSGILVL